MPVKRFIINPPKKMTEESVREAAEKMFATIKGIDAGAQLEKPLEPPEQAQDAAESVDVVEEHADWQDDGKAHGDSGDEDDEKS